MTRCRGDDGSVTALELVLITPVFLGLLVFVVLCGRMGRTAQVVHNVAAAAARAASLERTHDAAVAAANSVVTRADADLTCGVPEVSFGSDGAVDTVTVRVRCDASLAGLSLLPIGGARTFRALSVEALDAYRGR